MSWMPMCHFNLTSFCGDNSPGPLDIPQEIRAGFAQSLTFRLKIGIVNTCLVSNIVSAREDTISIAPSWNRRR
jgi:hypothetical protein